MNNRQEKLVKNTLLLSLGTLFPRLANFITLPILTAYLTKAEYGTFDLITVLVTLYLPAITLQIQTAAFRFLIDERDNAGESKSIISNIFAFTIPTSLAGLFVLWFFLPAENDIKIFICLYFAVDIIVNTTRQITRGLQKNSIYSISAIVAAFGNMLLDVILIWWFRLGLSGAILALVISAVLSLVVNSFGINLLSFFDIHSISWSKICKILKYSWPMVPNNMSMWIMRMSDRLVVTAVLGLAADAVYAVANKIPNLLNVAQSAFTYAWQENASVVSKDKDAGEYYSSVFRSLFGLMAGLLGIIICMTPIMFKVLIRGDYMEAYDQMPVLFLAVFFYAMATFFGGIYVAYMRTKNVGISTAIAAICNLVIDIVLIRKIGLFAASYSTLVSYLLLFIYRMIDVQKIVKIKIDAKRFIAILCILVVECLLCYQKTVLFDAINVAIGFISFFCLNHDIIISMIKRIVTKI